MCSNNCALTVAIGVGGRACGSGSGRGIVHEVLHLAGQDPFPSYVCHQVPARHIVPLAGYLSDRHTLGEVVLLKYPLPSPPSHSVHSLQQIGHHPGRPDYTVLYS